MHLNIHHEAKLKCPYKGCGKSFDRPAVLTDSSTFPRRSNYACPHCMSKIDLKVEKMKVVHVSPLEYPKVFESPAKCANYTGFLHATLADRPIPDECLICPKVLQCSIKKK
jgi:DNA-directed RNA polymerase subunit RPC12/RpoP